MKSLLITFIVLLCLVDISLAQTRRQRTRPTAARAICKVTSIPSGMVLVGYKESTACEGNPELVARKPGASDTVCADSPVPEGYYVTGLEGSILCASAGRNALTNAFSITRGEASPLAAERNTALAGEQNLQFALDQCKREEDRQWARLTRKEEQTGYSITNMEIVNMELGTLLCETKARKALNADIGTK